MNRKLYSDQRGLALIETIVAVALLGLILGSLLDLTRLGMGCWERLERSNEVRQNLRIGLDMITRDLKGAREITQLKRDCLYFRSYSDMQYRYQVEYDNKLKLYTLRRYCTNTAANSPVGLYYRPGGLAVTYYSDGRPVPVEQYNTLDPKKVNRVKISLTAGSGGAGDITYVSAVRIGY